MDFELCFKVHNSVNVQPKTTNLKVIFHVMVSIYRLLQIWNSPQFPAELRNGLCTLKDWKYRLTESVRSFIFARSYSKPMIISLVSFMVYKAQIFISRTPWSRHFYCLLFSLFSTSSPGVPFDPLTLTKRIAASGFEIALFYFRLNSSSRNKTGTHVFCENGVHYLKVFPGAHPLPKKPEDSRY